jgi:hypothetical protein
VTPDETPTFEMPVDALAAAVEAAAGMSDLLVHGELEVYLGRHRQLGHLVTYTLSRWSLLT